ncbi:MAG: hypothetical protein OXG46_09335 [Chloroflexi bacterium]|nr:hypothetical protein [Chloroflexota bacterium]MCY3939388.1 hypothetical protein [Chloroflexota bacterium]
MSDEHNLETAAPWNRRYTQPCAGRYWTGATGPTPLPWTWFHLLAWKP